MTSALPGGSSNFFVAFRVLSPGKREAIRAVYGFCRRVDDAVDETEDAAAARAALEDARRELAYAFDQRRPGSEASPLARTVAAFRLPRQPFEDLIEGATWDLEGRRYDTTEDLRAYCRRVASAVGLLCVRIFGCLDPACARYAEELGVALQWTNILRDLGEDLGRGRVYLPLQTLRSHGLTPEDLASPDPAARARLTSLVREQAAYARACMGAARRALPGAERPKVLAAEIMAAVYAALLRKIEKRGAGVLDRSVRLSALRRGFIALRVVIRHRFPARRGEGS